MRISDWSSDVCSSDLPAMHAELARHDPDTAARLAPNDSQRLQRAIEIWRLSGRCMSDWLRDASEPLLPDYQHQRSEERRVGKECVSTCRSRWSTYHYKK